jgi:hypothetical protein
MKLMALMTIATAAWAGNVAVCVKDNAGVPQTIRRVAEALASRMFDSAGLNIEWRCGQALQVVIELSSDTPSNVRPGALAYALAYEGIHIHVFYDRVRRLDPASATPFLLGDVLGHVLVHEIAHLLGRSDNHSETGVMKPHWTRRDYEQMQPEPIPFTAEDISLIRNGLVLRNQTNGRE